MPLFPQKLEVTNTFQEISSTLFDIFPNKQKFKIINRTKIDIELIIDNHGDSVIDSTYNGKGVAIYGLGTFNEYQRMVGLRLPQEFVFDQNFKYYVRSLGGTINIDIEETTSSVSSVEVTDQAGRTNMIGTFGEQWATDLKNDILAQFSYGKSDRDLKNETIVGSGSVTIQDSNLLTASTGTDANGLAAIESYNSVRYRPGHTIVVNFSALFTNPTADNCHQWIGLTDDVNGFGIGFENGELFIMRIKDGVHTHTPVAEFNGNVDPTDIDFTKLNIFRLTIGYLGASPITFEVMPPDGTSYKTLHVVKYQGTLDGTHINIPYLPIRMHVENTGNTTDIQIRSGSWQAGSLGFCQTCGIRSFAYPNTAGPATKTGVGTTPIPLAAFRSKDTFNGFTNKIRSVLNSLSFISYNGEGLVSLQLIANPTLTGTEGIDYNFTDIDVNNSVIEISTDVPSFTGGIVGLTRYQYPTTLGSKPTPSTVDIDGEKLGLFMDPNQVYVVSAVVSVDTVDIAWTVNWNELF